jgi:outer membrane immunogenic protein
MNMKKLTLLVAALSTISLAHADSFLDQTYASLKLGASIAKANDLSKDYNYNQVNNVAGVVVDSGRGHASTSDDKTVFTGSVAYGYAFETLPVRAELEYTFRSKADLDNVSLWTNRSTDAEVRTQNLMANVYYDFKNKSKFTPYVSAGIGAAFNKLETVERTANVVTERASDKKTDFAWALGVGVNYEITNNLDLDLAYRYMDSGKVDATYRSRDVAVDYTANQYSNYETKLKNHDFTVGLRYKF